MFCFGDAAHERNKFLRERDGENTDLSHNILMYVCLADDNNNRPQPSYMYVDVHGSSKVEYATASRK